MRPQLAALCIAPLIAAGCGSASAPPSNRGTPPGGSIEALWKRPGEDVGLVQGTSDYAPGAVRASFLVVRGDGSLVERPQARVWLARGRHERPFQRGVATLEPIGVPGGAEDDHEVTHLYVARLRVPGPGTYWLLAEPTGAARPIQALGNLVVKERTATPAVGERAFPSRTPTLASTGGDLEQLTTADPPDRELLQTSVADALRARRPFVLAFATPKFCASRTCGPVVDVVDAVRRSFAGTGVEFIHVEIYEANNPTLGVNRWVKQWRLPSEPWVFVVGRDGRIAAKFEGSVSVAELTSEVRALERR